MEKYINYAKAFSANDKVINWLNSNLKNYLEKNQENQDEIEHIIDYLISNDAPKRIIRMSYKEALNNTKKWNKKLQKKGRFIDEDLTDIEIVKDFNDGFKIVKLIGKKAYQREGYLMRHCVSSYYGKNAEIYSLRDHNNMPHCTMEKNQQIKGKGNGSINPKYIKYIVSFLEETGMTVGDNEMKNLGYYNAEKIKDSISNKLFNNKYIHEDEIILDKYGNEFYSLDLLDIKPLFVISETTLKFNFELPKFIKGSFNLLYKNVKNSSSGDNSKLASSGNGSQLASSEYYSQLASSGYCSKLASSGNGSQLASSGYSSKLASSGYSSKLASSGNGSQLASSGNGSQLASSGYSSKLASSGDYSQLASSGYSSQLASSGDYSQLASSGDNSIVAAIGVNSIAKGIIGNWIVLAEFDNSNVVKYVKSAKIDGKLLKENTYYKLKNNEFVEAK